MARTNLPLTSPVPNGAVLNVAGTAIDQANGMIIALPTSAIPAVGSLERLILYVTNTFAGVNTVTVRKGASVAAFESGKGDLVTGNLTASTGQAWIGPFEVARFLQVDGSVWVDFSATMTGLIYAILLPRAF